VNYQPFLNRDWNSMQRRPRRRLRRAHLHAAVVVASVAIGVALLTPTDRADAIASQAPVLQPEPLQLPLPEELPEQNIATESPTTAVEWQTVTVHRGDTLAAIFQRQGLSSQLLHAMVNAGGPAGDLARLHPGNELRFAYAEDGTLNALHYSIGRTRTLAIERQADGFTAALHEHPVERRITHASGTIDSSLYLSGREAGLSDNLIMGLAEIFAWDVDFALDIRQGDHFTLLYEEQWLDGEKLRDGAILAAEFINRGRVVRAVRFTDPDGNSNYYTPEGLSMRKAFLRSPVDFRRISSRFQRERWHPVLGKKRPHRGVDYAAAIGTPIKASGDGRITFRGRKGGYGNTVVIEHGGRYTTLYAHLSKFRGGLRSGSRVKQGQIIGYVGQTGLATGPHLHYEFRVHGVHRNPLTVELPNADPIPSRYEAEFRNQSQRLLAQLDVVKRTRVALANP